MEPLAAFKFKEALEPEEALLALPAEAAAWPRAAVDSDAMEILRASAQSIMLMVNKPLISPQDRLAFCTLGYVVLVWRMANGI